MIRIEINTDNAAFDGDDKPAEIARMLRDIADRLESGSIETDYEHLQGIRDINGNITGSLEVL